MSKQITKDEYKDTDEYTSMVEEIISTITETKFNAEMTIVEGKHKIGESVVTNPLYKKFGKGTGTFVTDLASDIGISERDLYYCINFYLKFPDMKTAVEELPGGKTISWRKVRGLLSDGQEESDPCEHKSTFEITLVQCKKCGARKKKGENWN